MVQKSMLAARSAGHRRAGQSRRPATRSAEDVPATTTSPRCSTTARSSTTSDACSSPTCCSATPTASSSVNGGNFFYLGVGKVGAIDNEAFCPSLEEVEKFAKTDRGEVRRASSRPAHVRDATSRTPGSTCSPAAIESSGVHKDAPMGSPKYLMTSFDEWAKKRFAGLGHEPEREARSHATKMLGIYGDPADREELVEPQQGLGTSAGRPERRLRGRPQTPGRQPQRPEGHLAARAREGTHQQARRRPGRPRLRRARSACHLHRCAWPRRTTPARLGTRRARRPRSAGARTRSPACSTSPRTSSSSTRPASPS